MTGSEFLAYVKSVFGRSDKDTQIYEAMTDVVTDMRLRLLSEDFQQEAYVTGIATLGDYRIALPADVGHLIGDITIVDTESDQTYQPIPRVSKEKYDEMNHERLASSTGNQNTGIPQYFCVYAEQIYLGPVPDKTTYKYYINYTTEDNNAIISTTSSVPFTDKYRQIVRDGVLALVFKEVEAFAEAQQFEAAYERGLSKINDSEKFNQDSVTPVMYSGV